MDNLKLVELYTVLLVLCVGLLLFGLYQMQITINSAMGLVDVTPLQAILQGLQVSAAGIVLSASIMVLFFKKLKKRHLAKP